MSISECEQIWGLEENMEIGWEATALLCLERLLFELKEATESRYHDRIKQARTSWREMLCKICKKRRRSLHCKSDPS